MRPPARASATAVNGADSGQNGANGSGPVSGRHFAGAESGPWPPAPANGEEKSAWEPRAFAAPFAAGEQAWFWSERLDFPGLSIDPATRIVEVAGRSLVLTRREFDLLYFLARHARCVFTRLQLLNHVWGWDSSSYEDTVTVHISRLRAKLRRHVDDRNIIQTAWGTGYKFEPPGERM